MRNMKRTQIYLTVKQLKTKHFLRGQQIKFIDKQNKINSLLNIKQGIRTNLMSIKQVNHPMFITEYLIDILERTNLA